VLLAISLTDKTFILILTLMRYATLPLYNIARLLSSCRDSYLQSSLNDVITVIRCLLKLPNTSDDVVDPSVGNRQAGVNWLYLIWPSWAILGGCTDKSSYVGCYFPADRSAEDTEGDNDERADTADRD